MKQMISPLMHGNNKAPVRHENASQGLLSFVVFGNLQQNIGKFRLVLKGAATGKQMRKDSHRDGHVPPFGTFGTAHCGIALKRVKHFTPYPNFYPN